MQFWVQCGQALKVFHRVMRRELRVYTGKAKFPSFSQLLLDYRPLPHNSKQTLTQLNLTGQIHVCIKHFYMYICTACKQQFQGKRTQAYVHQQLLNICGLCLFPTQQTQYIRLLGRSTIMFLTTLLSFIVIPA